MIERALLIRVARIIATTLNLRPIRTTVDTSGTMTHFVSTTRKSKLDFKFSGVYSKKLTLALEQAVPDALDVLVHEARVPVLVGSQVVTAAPYLTGQLAMPPSVVILFSVDPIGTLTVRQREVDILPNGNLK